MTKSTILVLTPDFPPARGGIQLLSHRIISSWRLHEPVVVTLPDKSGKAFDAKQPFDVRRSPNLPGPRALAIAALNGQGALVGMRRRPAAVLSTHIVTAPAAAFLARRLGVPFVQYVHAKELGVRPGLARFALTRAAAVVAVSRYTAELAIACGATPARVRLIHPGVDQGAGAADEARQRSDSPLIVTTSRLEDRYKGHDVTLRAMPLLVARHPDLKWVVIGDGPLRPVLERRAAMLGVDGHVDFLGRVDDTERDEWLERAWAFVMVSRLPAGGYAGEGFGIVYLEAGAHGLPVLAGAAGGALDAVVSEETGMLVDAEDPLAVAGGLHRLLGDDHLRMRLGEAGRARAARLSWERASGDVENLIEELVSHG